MPLLNTAYVFSPEESSLLQCVVTEDGHSHTDWSADELMPIRSNIRGFCRTGQRGVCAYCKQDVSLVSASNAHVEHIAPKSIYLSFMFEPKNLCVVCADCNQIKRDQEVMNDVPDTLVRDNVRYPRSSSAFKIVHPHFDEYDDHIGIYGKIYVDLTDKGMFTIAACKLNRFYRTFGRDNPLVDDNVLTEIMNKYLGSQSDLEKARTLQELQSALLNI